MQQVSLRERMADEPLQISPLKTIGGMIVMAAFLLACYAPETIAGLLS